MSFAKYPNIIRARAPLRLGLAGGGSDLSPFCDVYGGYVLNAAIDLYAYAYIEPSTNGNVEFRSPDTGKEFSARAVPEFETNGSNLALHCAVYNRVIKQFCGNRPTPMRMITYCDVPSGSGLGSSSTLVVAMLKAFSEWLSLPLGEYDMARLAFEIERRDLCLSGGRQDQYAATFGGFNFMEFYANERVIVNPLRLKDWIIAEVEASLVLFYTGSRRESARIIGEQTRNIEENKPRSVNATLALKEDALMMKEAMLKGDLKQFAYFMGKSWEAKKCTAESVSNSKIDQFFGVAMEAGALAGKVSGAGGGGFIMFIVDPACRPDVISALNRCDGGRVVPCHFTKNGTEGWRSWIE